VDLTWCGASPWRDFLSSSDKTTYPVAQLSDTLERLRSMVEEMRGDRTTATNRLSDDMNHINPAHCVESLVQLMLGAIPVRDKTVQGCPKSWANFLWEYNCQRLKLAQFLSQLGVFSPLPL
jgi:hypothetical protein